MQIVHYVSDEGKLFKGKDEYVVLFEDGDNPDDELIEGFRINSTEQADCLTHVLPMNRKLITA